MFRIAATLVLACLIAESGRADVDPADLQGALALQRAVQQAIRDAEPSIACLLVSRSDRYARFRAGVEAAPGRLGAFEASDQLRDDERRRLDLANLDVIPESFGSGVVVDVRGLILTNYHVVRGATKVFVRLPGSKGSYADIHAADSRSDLAVLKLINPPANLQPLRFGDAGKIERGEFILTLANPYAAGFRDGQPSTSWGIISNIRRRVPGAPREQDRVKSLHHYGALLQLDARLNLGCSGGALLNLRGELIGLTSSLAAIHGGETPGGFAIPLDAGMRRIIEVLRRGEEVDYGFLGVGFDDSLRLDEGVLLNYVVEGSPASRDAGLRQGDLVLTVDGIAIRESDDLFLELGKQLAGARVKLKVRRRNAFPPRVDEVVVTLAKLNYIGDNIASSTGSRPYFRGLRVDYASVLAQQRNVIPQGVMVADIKMNSVAAATPLKHGDIITHVNRQPVLSPAAFYQAVMGLAGPAELTLDNGEATVILR